MNPAPDYALLEPRLGSCSPTVPLRHHGRRRLTAPAMYRPTLEDYTPLRRRSDTLEIPGLLDEYSGSRRCSAESYTSQNSAASGDSLILPAVTVSRPSIGCNAASDSEEMVLPSVTITEDPQDEQRVCSLYVPATRVRNALLMRGRRHSAINVASAVFEHSTVSQIYFTQRKRVLVMFMEKTYS